MTGADLAAVLTASLVGSTHCAMMCGPFLPLLQPNRNAGAPLLRSVGYHLGRGIAYLSLGATAGLLGTSLQHTSASILVQRAVAIAMAAGLVFAALRMAWPGPQLVKLRRPPKEPRFSGIKDAILRLREHKRPVVFPLALGLGSALLPCAWLWSYVWLAATRTSVPAAVATMGAFWLGTLPALSLLTLLAPSLRRRLGRHAPKLGALALLLLAGWTLYERWPSESAPVPSHCAPTTTPTS